MYCDNFIPLNLNKVIKNFYQEGKKAQVTIYKNKHLMTKNNVLYKNNGTDRYPDFKLYKMISRCVHNHTPHAQLDRPEFKKFEIIKEEIQNEEIVMNIDEMS